MSSHRTADRALTVALLVGGSTTASALLFSVVLSSGFFQETAVEADTPSSRPEQPATSPRNERNQSKTSVAAAGVEIPSQNRDANAIARSSAPGTGRDGAGGVAQANGEGAATGEHAASTRARSAADYIVDATGTSGAGPAHSSKGGS